MDNLTQRLSNIDLSVMNNPKTCQIIIHYAEMNIFPNTLYSNIDWANELIKIKPNKTFVLSSFQFYPDWNISIRLNDIIDNEDDISHSIPTARIELVKEWAKSSKGRQIIFKNTQICYKDDFNYITIPVINSNNEIHICVLNLSSYKFALLFPSMKITETQRFVMFIDLSDGLRNHLSITGSVMNTGLNVMKALFVALESKKDTNYITFSGSDIIPVPLIQMVYSSIPYFPELQVVWNTDSDITMSDSIPVSDVDLALVKFPSGQNKLKSIQDKWLQKRSSSELAKPPKSRHIVKPNNSLRFSAIWPEVENFLK